MRRANEVVLEGVRYIRGGFALPVIGVNGIVRIERFDDVDVLVDGATEDPLAVGDILVVRVADPRASPTRSGL